ncbi:hypothetical protein PVL29_021535 [Vitis rotundifolia]|uniref:Uncharacterized protein n=1 Tax=Vitis rotundifolia TaxID=103349 RepID=A0AA38YZX9_VITRO|nr:hypothetical protein PVL29_021535 [Vitis rotundifolia]
MLIIRISCKILSQQNKISHIILSFPNFTGVLPTQLGNLSNLQSLDLSDNFEMSCENLEWLSHLPLLTHLDLNGVDLSKAIHWPQAINKMPSSLTELYLSFTKLPWIIPTISISHTNSSTSLAVLDLSLNGLTSSINPWLFYFSSSLVHLDLFGNDLNGSIPDALGNMTNLAYLDLSLNQLEGEIPKSFSISLAHLDLSWNQLHGSIPDAFGNMTTLAYLDLSSNHLNGLIPDALGNMTTLAHLYLSANQLEGEIPKSLRDLCNLQILLFLYLSENQFKGSLPDLSGFSQLRELYLGFNQLNGTLHESIGQLAQLQGLNIRSNSLQGTVSANHLFGLSKLWDLDLSFNSLTVNISLEQSSWGLLHVDLSNNQLSRELPKCWEQWKYLIVLNLTNNNFSGKVKNSIGMLYQMQTLHLRNNNLLLIDLGKNKLSGKMPAWIGGSLSDLIVVNLRSNEFNGSIPLNLCQLKKVQMLDLSSNNLFGIIPKCLKNLTAMSQNGSLVIAYEERLFVFDPSISYIDNTVVQWKGKELEYKKTLGLVKSIDFSNNKLNGEIPIEVTDLVELLHGGIPVSLSQIAGLSVLDLSNNILSSKIPSGTQLQSFNASTYDGNPGLCGPPLLKKCQEDETKEVSFTSLINEKDIQDDTNDIWFYGNIVHGFIIGFWGVCGTLLLNRSWRYSYF